LASSTGVGDLLERYPATLSGGETQRVALARALATKPRCLLLDEPLSSLDTQARTQMRGLLRGLHRQGHTVVHVTHDYEEAVSLATRVGVMEGGTIVQAGDPAEVFHHPKSEFIARFTGIRNVFKGRISPGEGGVSRFDSGPIAFTIAGDGYAGPGCAILRSEDITISRAPMDTSAQNSFAGVVTDVVGARLGMEVTVDIGVEVIALITAGSVQRLDVHRGQRVWVSFKATAARFVEE
jgi:molybdopterin-binding protein